MFQGYGPMSGYDPHAVW